ncbi:uncharacterized protein STEHIDRAFT_59192 [Stereum hirsutum FP-91666 SS1]|uniref:uncharacterized protein n=1 Tax=Stereum hirsutum (strain FP-91666) TaxID=721885 RepID=UPI0004449919|nr:uncharacterized protein STEHIDRAFT_59192 [Stereum hirsutum FP-91666 SS1]EIM85578.1 hypothetical protein STEHIDRAFT_59192 [Stereum hirsutum FP-91666 SS1]
MTAWNDATKYFRIVALSFFVYDWIVTLPAEIRLYRKQRCWYKPSTACILLIMTRYIGLAAICLNLFGFFGHNFTQESCERYYHVMPIVQCVASWASHIIFVVRTSAIWNKERLPTVSLSLLAFIVSAVEIFAQLFAFRKFKAGSSGNCLIQYSKKVNIGWVYYMVCLVCSTDNTTLSSLLAPARSFTGTAGTIFDIIIIIVTYQRLVANFNSRAGKRGNEANGGTQAEFNQVLWSSSLAYFIITTVSNVLNLIFFAYYNNSDSTVLAPLGIALTSMMSARIILDLHDYANRPRNSTSISLSRSTNPWNVASDSRRFSNTLVSPVKRPPPAVGLPSPVRRSSPTHFFLLSNPKWRLMYVTLSDVEQDPHLHGI